MQDGGTQPLENPTHEIFAVETAGGLDDEDAVAICGAMCRLPAKSNEVPGKRRSRVARQALRRIDARIRSLEALEGGPALPSREAELRNYRAVAELRWCRALVANGGMEPEEWFEDGDLEEASGAAS
jgi:hypothetical protein